MFILSAVLFSCEKEGGLMDALDTDRFIVVDPSKGMGGEQVRDIFCDSRNELWFACYGDGITRYNGTTFQSFNDANSPLAGVNVLCITEDGDGDMWFGTSAGIHFLVDNSEWHFHGLLEGVDVRINVLYTDPDKKVWIGTEGQGLFTYDEGNFYGPLLFGEPAELNYINDIAKDHSGNLWLATNYSALKDNGEYWNIYTYNQETPRVNALHADSNDKLWIGVDGWESFPYFDGSKFEYLNPFNGQPNNFVMDITSDHSGNIWFATFLDGIIKYDGAVMHSYKPYNGFPSEDNYCLEVDNSGNVWIGTTEFGAIKYIPPVQF